MNKLQAAEQLRRALQMFAETLSDEQAMEIATVYPVWEAGKVYAVDNLIAYGTNSVGDPQLYRCVQAHTSQEGWEPSAVPALWDAVGLDEAGHPIWAQPTGAHDAYNTGDVVDYNGTLYESLIDGNITVPGSDERWWTVYVEA